MSVRVVWRKIRRWNVYSERMEEGRCQFNYFFAIRGGRDFGG